MRRYRITWNKLFPIIPSSSAICVERICHLNKFWMWLHVLKIGIYILFSGSFRIKKQSFFSKYKFWSLFSTKLQGSVSSEFRNTRVQFFQSLHWVWIRFLNDAVQDSYEMGSSKISWQTISKILYRYVEQVSLMKILTLRRAF